MSANLAPRVEGTTCSPEQIQKKRLIRLTIAHYKNENASEEETYKWGTEYHAVRAAKIHSKHGIEGYALHWSPSSFRNSTKALNASLGDRWVIRDHDLQVEFYIRDMATLQAVAADPDFQALQSEEGPYVSKIHIEASLGWVEYYLQDGKIVNVTPEDKPAFLGFECMSTAP